MSKPRERWWGYVKNVLYAYPVFCAELRTIRGISAVPMDSMPRSRGAKRTTENTALRGFSGQKAKEYEAVERAISETERLPEGAEVMRLVELVFFKRRCSLSAAADRCHVSYTTAVRWHGDFIRRVAKYMELR